MCKENTASINPIISETKSGGKMILSKCDVCNSKKSRFIEQKKQKDYYVICVLEHL